MKHDKNSITHYACAPQLEIYEEKTPCCACNNHDCIGADTFTLDTYNPMSHSEKECRGDHPVLRKVPVGFQGYHIENYQDL